jgi:hypothetical protein
LKKYMKPRIVFDSFKLSESIATCAIENALPTEGSCGYPSRYGNVFMDIIQGCVYKEQDGEYNGVCYHNPTEYNNLFGS